MTQAEALSILKTGANVFLTGEPGSGKTHTINEYVSYLRGQGIEPAITASTGIAATHIRGMTIHSWSGIGIKNKLDKYDLDRIASTKHIVKRVGRAKVLIIDEISMLLPETFSMVDAVCREIKQSNEPFGGIQAVLVGDFFQLPPVVRKNIEDDRQEIITYDEEPPRFAYSSAIWKKINPFICYLTEQYRQDDKDFLGVLSAIRKNIFNEDHLRHIEKSKIVAHQVPKDAPKLFSHNADVDRVNEEILRKLPVKEQIFKMNSRGPQPIVMALKRGCLSPETLRLKAGTAVMFTKNNPKEGFVNGTLGRVEGFSSANIPIVITRNGRRIEVGAESWAMEEGGKVLAWVMQVPLRLAWAITVHKSQGMSLDEAAMDLHDVFEYGQGYVALSRVRRLSGLHLLGWNERAFQVHPEVLEEDNVFRARSEEAYLAFEKLGKDKIAEMHKKFIRAIARP